MAVLDLAEALRELTTALDAVGARARDARTRAARQVLVSRLITALDLEVSAQSSIDVVVKLAANASSKSARRSCAALMVHALAIPHLIPPAAFADVCGLVESALRNALLRSGYPFLGSIEEKIRLLTRLHGSVAELMQPLEPTFPNWPGLYAG